MFGFVWLDDFEQVQMCTIDAINCLTAGMINVEISIFTYSVFLIVVPEPDMLPLPHLYLAAHTLQLHHLGGVGPAGLVTCPLLDSRPVLVNTGELGLGIEKCYY